MSQRIKCLLLLMVCAILWSLGGVLIKSINWNPVAIAGTRSLVAAFTIIFLARAELDFKVPKKLELLGSFFLAAVSLCFVIATSLTSAANAVFIQYTAPVWVAIAAPYLLKERTTLKDIVFICLVFCGMGLFFKESLSYDSLRGIIAAILASFFFAAWALSLRMSQDGNSIKIVVYGNLLLALSAFIYWRPPWPGFSDLLLLLIAGVFQFGLPCYLFALASKGVSGLEMVLLTTLEPILNPVWVFLFIGERPSFWSLVGGLVVISSITLWTILKIPPRPRKEIILPS